jgi:hypothetical protein
MARRLVVALLASMPLLLGGEVLAADAPQLRVTIRRYDNFGVPPSELIAATAVVDDIFSRAGVTIVWRNCDREIDISQNGCADAPGSMEVLLRLVLSPKGGDATSDVVGFAHIDNESHAGVLATVMADRAFEMARRSHAPGAVVLGRAMAHEVGHLLLGTSRHATRGLMRGHWTDVDLALGGDVTWQFSQSESASIRRELLTRQGPSAPRVAQTAPESQPSSR